MGNKKRGLIKIETSITPLPQFESIDIAEIDSYKNHLLEQSYDPNLNEFQKVSYIRAIEILDEHMLNLSAYHLIDNTELHKDSFNINWVQIHNQESLGLKLDEWNDLGINIGIDKVIFTKISSNATRELFLTSLNWNNKSI